MSTLLIVVAGLVLYAAGIGLFIRFAAFVHRCDDEMKSMLEKPSVHRPKFRLRPRRSSKPRLRTA